MTTNQHMHIVSLPVNVAADDEHLFIPYQQFFITHEDILRFTDVIVTRSGFCMTENGLTEYCHHRYPDQYANYLQEVKRYLGYIRENEVNLVKPGSQDTYLLIHHPWFNYYHWLFECVSRIWSVRESAEKYVLLLPSNYRTMDFIQATIKPFRFKSIYYIPEKKSVYVASLCMPAIKPVVESYNPVLLKEIKQFFISFYCRDYTGDHPCYERIYISRRKANRRKIENEEELIAILQTYHFHIINCEDYSFAEQVLLFSNASYLVSIHGSGLSNMLFMKNNSRILELQKEITNERDWHSKAFWYLADSLGYDYFQQLCKPSDPAENYFHANYIVDPSVFENNLQWMVNLPKINV